MSCKSTRQSLLPTLTGVLLIAVPHAFALAGADRYHGKYCDGEGDVEFLRLIDESFAFFHPSAVVPNVTMLY
jgi:hypothetical protein